MALKTKEDYFGLNTLGWTVTSTNENRSIGTAEATSNNGFVIAIESFGEKISPQADYVATTEATLEGLKIGSVKVIDGKSIALGSISITTKAGEAVTASASGSQIEDSGVAHCTCTLQGISVSPLFHAQTFGLFSISNGQLTDSTLNIEGNIATAEKEGTIVASDLVGCKITVSGTVVGVDDSGNISTPTLSVITPTGGKVLSGVITSPLSLQNPNGDFPSYSFTITYGLKAD